MPKKISQLVASTTLADTDLFEKANPGVASTAFSGASLRSTLLNPATIGGTAATIPMFAAASPFLANSPLVVASGLVGAGTLAPASALHIATSLTTSPRGIMSSQHNNGTDGARFHLRKSRGTNAAPTVIVSGDNLGRLVATGYDGSNYLEMASIIFGTQGTIGANRIPSNISFWTATDASPSVLTQAMTIIPGGLVGIGTATPDVRLNIHNSNVGQTTLLKLRNNDLTTGSTADIDFSVTAAATMGRIGLTRTAAVDGDLTFSTYSGGAGTLTEKMRILGLNGSVGIGTISPDRLLHPELQNAVTNAISYVQRITHGTSGVSSAGFGVGVEFENENSDGVNVLSSFLESTLSTVGASWLGDFIFKAADSGGAREFMRGRGSGSAAMLSFFGVAPVIRQPAIAAADGSIGDITTKFNNLLTYLKNYGLLT